MILKLILFLSTVFILCVSALFLFQSKLLFFPVHLEQNHVFKVVMPFEEKFISSGDQEIIHGVLFKPSHPAIAFLKSYGKLLVIINLIKPSRDSSLAAPINFSTLC